MIKYAISIQDCNNITEYVCRGEHSYFSLSSSVFKAEMFDTQEDAEEQLKHKEFTSRNTYADKTSMPPSMIWSGLGICNKRPESDGFINIIKIEVNNIKCVPIKDKIEYT